jgi:hypothetical protein
MGLYRDKEVVGVFFIAFFDAPLADKKRVVL